MVTPLTVKNCCGPAWGCWPAEAEQGIMVWMAEGHSKEQVLIAEPQAQ